MNYSRYLFISTFAKEIKEILRYQNEVCLQTGYGKTCLFLNGLISEVNYQIHKIYEKQNGGKWPITKGDKVFIETLLDLYEIINRYASRNNFSRHHLFSLLEQLGIFVNKLESLKEGKIKTVFLTQETVSWPTFESVYEAFLNDPRCDTQLVYVPFNHVNMAKNVDWFNEYKEMGLNIVQSRYYNLSEESPEFVFFIKPYDCIPMEYYIDDVDKIIRRTIHIPYRLHWMEFENIPLFMDYHFRLPLHYKAWRIFETPEDMKEEYARYGYRNGENVVTLGNPRFDSIKKFSKIKREIPPIWVDKFSKKKVIMWNPHFNSEGSEKSKIEWATFDLFGKMIISYFLAHQDIALLFRPHPLFFNGLITSGIMTENEIDDLRRTIAESSNIILDTLPDYRYAFSVSDALISDGSSLLLEFLMFDKPILYTYQSWKPTILNKKFLKAFYKGSCWENIVSFIEMVRQGKDQIQKERQQLMNKLCLNIGNNIGENIKNYCINEMIDEEIKSAQSIIQQLQERKYA